MKKKLTLLMVAFLTLTAFAATMAIKKVTDVPAAVTGDFHWEEATSIAAGDVVLIAVDNGNVTKELGGLSTTATVYGVATDYTGTPAGLYPLTVEAGSTTGTFAFKNGDKYLNWTSGNSLTASETKDANASWTVTFADGKASIVNAADNTRNLMYNAGSPRFACYNNTNQTAVTLWKKVAGAAPTPTGPNFYVMGSGLPGLTWDTSSLSSTNKMEVMATAADAYYKKYSGVILTAGTTIYYKFYDDDGNWYPTGTGNNMDYYIEATGIYDVSFTLFAANFNHSNPYESSQISVEKTADISSVANIGRLTTLENNALFQLQGEVVVVAKPTPKYVYVKDDTGSTLIYDAQGTKTENAEVGKTIAGNWTGKVSIYKKLFEAVPDAALTMTEAAAVEVTYPEKALSYVTAEHLNEVVTLTGVTYTTPENKGFTITKESEPGTAVNGYNQFNYDIAAPETGKTYTIVGAISCYNDNIQFLPITITEETVVPEEPVVWPTGLVGENWKITTTATQAGATAPEAIEDEPCSVAYLTDANVAYLQMSVKVMGMPVTVTMKGAVDADKNITIPKGQIVAEKELAGTTVRAYIFAKDVTGALDDVMLTYLETEDRYTLNCEYDIFLYLDAAATQLAYTLENTIIYKEKGASVPGTAIWESTEPYQLDWSNNVLIPADKFANAKVGDVIHVALTDVPTAATHEYDAQVFLKGGANYKNVEAAVNVAGTATGSFLAKNDSPFTITGDILAIAKAQGLMICGQGGIKTALVTLESVPEALGSDQSIWVGEHATGATEISNWHFANFRDFTGVKVGDIVRVTLEESNWVTLCYNKGWVWTEFTEDDIDVKNDWTNPVVDIVLKSETAVKELNDAENNNGVFVNTTGKLVQVELITPVVTVDKLYIVGSVNGGWELEPGKPNLNEMAWNSQTEAFECEVNVTEDVLFVFGDALSDTWDDFTANHRIGKTSTEDIVLADGQSVQLEYVATNYAFKIPGTATGKYKLSVTKDLMLTVTRTGDADPENTYIVAGAPMDIFGTEWDGSNDANKMELQADGTYKKTYTVTKAYNDVQLKVVMNGTVWYGDANGENIVFKLTGAGTFTVIFNPKTNEVTVTGDIVELIIALEYNYVVAVGDGSGAWLNGSVWTPNEQSNKMTEASDDVWEITYSAVPAGSYQVKFAIDGAWTYNFGGTFSAFNEETEAVWIGDNIQFTTTDASDITLRLDLTAFNFGTKQGAKFTIIAGQQTITEPNYYVVGECTPLGLEWGVVAANKMELNTGGATNAKTYIKTYKKVTFKANDKIIWKIGGSTDDATISTWYPSGDNNVYTITADGDYDVTFICKPSMGFVDIDIQESSNLPVEDEGIIIKWDAPAAAGSLAAEYGVNPDFYMTWVDTNNNKLSIDANTAYFGDATSQKMFTHRFKTGGSSGNKNNITLHVGEAGKLRVYVRTGSNSATDRTLVLKQNGAELYSAVVQESDAIEVNEEDLNVKAPALADGDKKKVYPIIEVEVEEGEVSVEYPVNSLNFYAFQLIPDTGTGIRIIESDEQPMFNEALPAYNLQGQRVTKSYRGIVIQNGRKFYNK